MIYGIPDGDYAISFHLNAVYTHTNGFAQYTTVTLPNVASATFYGTWCNP